MRILRITALMAAIYVFFQLLPDFAPERPEALLRQASGDTSPELCDFSSLGFTEVSKSRSPFLMRLLAQSPPNPGAEVRVTLGLSKPGGAPVTLEEMEETHTEKFHLLIVDSSLEDYHHEHPEPTSVPGEFHVTFTPRKGGSYRFFADLLPVATGRPVQAVADLVVSGAEKDFGGTVSFQSVVDGYRFAVNPPEGGFRAKKAGLVSLEVERAADGEPAVLEQIMGAYAHLVAFDVGRSGFAHMHPVGEELAIPTDALASDLEFIFYADEPGLYGVWAQVKIDGQERFAPFVIEVL